MESHRLRATTTPSGRMGDAWQKRLQAAGLLQRDLGKLLGFNKSTISRQLRGHWQSGIPKHVTAAIVAWELMSEEQRVEWQRQMDALSANASSAEI